MIYGGIGNPCAADPISDPRVRLPLDATVLSFSEFPMAQSRRNLSEIQVSDVDDGSV
jgi:hypothetical protein